MAAPAPAGDHMFFLMPYAVLPAEPCTISMVTSRLGRPAALAQVDRPGAIASRKGRLIAAPTPLSTVRRDNVDLVMCMGPLVPFASGGRDLGRRHATRLKCGAMDDGVDTQIGRASCR